MKDFERKKSNKGKNFLNSTGGKWTSGSTWSTCCYDLKWWSWNFNKCFLVFIRFYFLSTTVEFQVGIKVLHSPRRIQLVLEKKNVNISFMFFAQLSSEESEKVLHRIFCHAWQIQQLNSLCFLPLKRLGLNFRLNFDSSTKKENYSTIQTLSSLPFDQKRFIILFFLPFAIMK